ncbi:MAG: argininosuccinate lyase [Chloroflexi bacterium]|nr:argininosuccinate lyase [Chloroflexota bacterium]
MKQWGGRFHKAASASAEAFNASLPVDIRLYREDILGSIAHARMLARQGIIPAASARQIVEALGAIHAELAASPPPLDLALEDVHTLVESRLRARVGDDAGRLHTARSRNDQVALDLRLFTRAALVEQIAALAALQRALLERAAAYPDAVMPGYTHLQRAQPVLLAHHLLAYVAMLQRDSERLVDAYRRTNVLPLGAGALAGVPYPIDRQYVATLLAFDAVSPNSLDAVADRDFAVESAAALALVQAHLSRLAEEWVLWSSSEFGFIEIDEAYATGSSIMPQKRNPDVAELIRGKTGRVYGHLLGLLTILKGLPLAYNKDLQEDKAALFDAVDTVLACTRIAAEMVAATEFRRDRLAAAAEADFSTATDLADHLAQRGVPFREAHRVVGELVRYCLASGRTLAELSLAELQRFSPHFTAEAVGLRAAQAVAARDVPGGTAPPQVRAALIAAQHAVQASEDWVAARRAAHPTVDDLVARAWE